MEPSLLFSTLLAAFTAALAVFALGPFAVATCRKLGLVVGLSSRRSHKVVTPHGGGFLLPLVVTPLALALVWAFHLPFLGFLTVLFVAGIPVAWVGWQDDKGHLDPRLRLAVHLPAVAFALVFLPPLFDFMPLWAEKLLLILAWGWFVNLYNFMDGADGLATSEAVALGLGLSLLVPAFAPLGLLIAAAALGFLRVNWSPAKVFMGDVCSTWLGYIFGGLLLVACADDTWRIIWPLATLPLVFCADATTTLIRRVATGYHPWEPHTTFWFHRFLALGHTHRQLAVAVAGVNCVLIFLAIESLKFNLPTQGFLIGILVMAAIMWYIRHIEQLKRG